MRIAPEVLVGQHEMPHRHGMVTTEPVPPTVAIPAELGLAALGVQPPLLGPEAEIAIADLEGRPGLDRLDSDPAEPQAADILGTAQGRPPGRSPVRDGEMVATRGEI